MASSVPMAMSNRRILVDFRRDQIIIMRSYNTRAAAGFRTIPFRSIRGNLVAVDATVGGIATTAIIDTGGQVTIANLALRRALETRWSRLTTRPDQIIGVTTDVQDGDAALTPPLLMGESHRGGVVEIRYHDMTFGDMHIFEHWHLTDEPAMLIGMDALGLLDTLIIDYRMHELQIRTRDRELDAAKARGRYREASAWYIITACRAESSAAFPALSSASVIGCADIAAVRTRGARAGRACEPGHRRRHRRCPDQNLAGAHPG